MPISADTSVLFIHIPKNAGKSVGRFLGIYIHGTKPPRSFPNRVATLLARLTTNQSDRSRLVGMVDVSLYGPHMTLQEILALGLLPIDDSSQITKVAVCRNPYDRAASIFNHMGGNYERSPEGFVQFWTEWPNSQPGKFRSDHNFRAFLRSQWEFCVDLDGVMAVDHVLRYEHLEEDLASLPPQLSRCHENLPWVGNNRTTRNYHQYYNDAGKALVDERFAKDFDFFRYDRTLNLTDRA